MALPLSDTFAPLLEAAAHGRRCGGTLATCACVTPDGDPVTDIWAVSGRPVPLVSPARWCVFPADVAEADAAWAFVRDLTRAGQLGFAAKLSSRDRLTSADRVQPAIIVYVADQADREEGSRMRSVLRVALTSAGLPQLAEVPFTFTSYGEKQISSQAPERNPGATPCRFFGTAGGCRNGGRCRFLHERSGGDGVGVGVGGDNGGIPPASASQAKPQPSPPLQHQPPPAPAVIPTELREILERQERQLALLMEALAVRQAPTQGDDAAPGAGAAVATTAAPLPPPASPVPLSPPSAATAETRK